MISLAPGGYLVVLEGIDGTGKSTISSAMAQFCGERGLACLFSREPTGLGAGRRLRESAASGRLSPVEELDLFLEDRREHVRRAIQPALDAGAVVILDRYYWSTAAYQGARGFDPMNIIRDNEAFAPRPDLVILLDYDPRSGRDRIRGRGDVPDEFESLLELEQVRSIFNRLHDGGLAGPSIRVVASGPLRQVQADVLAIFKAKLLERAVPEAASLIVAA